MNFVILPTSDTPLQVRRNATSSSGLTGLKKKQTENFGFRFWQIIVIFQIRKNVIELKKIEDLGEGPSVCSREQHLLWREHCPLSSTPHCLKISLLTETFWRERRVIRIMVTLANFGANWLHWRSQDISVSACRLMEATISDGL